MQVGVHGRFMDHSTAVREAAIELVGKFILIRPELTAQYFSMLSERILVSLCFNRLWSWGYVIFLSTEVNQFIFLQYWIAQLTENIMLMMTMMKTKNENCSELKCELEYSYAKKS